MVQYIALTGVAASAVLASVSATFTVTFTNKCSVDIDLYTRLASVYTDEHELIAPGASLAKPIGKGFEGHFRNGSNDAATLIEFATMGDLDLAWFDIGIIPPHLKPNHEFCASLDECKQHSESGIGFNTAVQVTPLSNSNGKNCRELTCLADACEDAYNFPQDDTKTHSCPFGTDFVVTFCPSGDATQQQSTSGSSSVVQEIIASKSSVPAEEIPTQEDVPSDDASKKSVLDNGAKGTEPETSVTQEEMPPAPEATLEVAAEGDHCV